MRFSPEISKKREVHGLEFYLYPEKIDAKFSGCQSIWLGDGYKLATAKYLKGEIIVFESQEPGEEKISCHYKNQQVLAQTAKGKCPSSAKFPLK